MMTPGRHDRGVGCGRVGLARVFGDLYAWVGAIALWKHEFTEAVDEYGQPEGLSGRTSPNSAG